MTKATFLQFHVLTSYPASLLNRDDAGFAKRIPFGGAVRTRISSQCLKRHWRAHDGEHSFSQGVSSVAKRSIETKRSRLLFQQEIVDKLVADGVSPRAARNAAAQIAALVLVGASTDKKVIAKRKVKAEKLASGKDDTEEVPINGEDDDDEAGEAASADSGTPARPVRENAPKSTPAVTSTESVAPLMTKEVVVLGAAELELLREFAKEIAAETLNVTGDKLTANLKNKAFAANIEALRSHAGMKMGLSAALFGRMVTGDVLARGDAAVHVAHAFTVHEEATESDYFSALDELQREAGETGSGHINSSELTSGLFYAYVAVDLPLLLKNVGGERDLAAKAISDLCHMLATVSPGAKKGSTAPYAYAHLVLAEVGSAQPRTLANAFLEPVRGRPNVVQNAYDAMAVYLEELEGMYGASASGRRLAGIQVPDRLLKAAHAEKQSLADVAKWAADQVPA